jgi:serine protease AprX
MAYLQGMRRLHLLVATLLCFAGPAHAQQWVWVQLADKGPAHYTPSSDYLSPQSWQRRSTQCIPTDRSDWPLYAPYLSQLHALGLQSQGHSRWFNLVWGTVPDAATVASLQQYPFVSEVGLLPEPKPTAAGAVSGCLLPNWDPGQMATEHLRTGLDSLHCRGDRGQGIDIAAFDSGFRDVNTLAAFDSLRLQGRLRTWYDFVDRDSLLFAEDWHGTAVVSRIAALQPGTYVGTAPKATLSLARTETVASETPTEMLNWLAAAEWADSLGAHIITSSLNYNTFDNGVGNLALTDLNGYSATITRAADMAVGRGMLVVVSAGNEGSNSSWLGRITSPCDGDSVLCVGSVTRTNWTVAASSGRGPTADGRLKPDVVAAGQSVPLYLGVAVSTGSGTSYAAPYAAGAAACLWQAHPEATAWQVRGALMRTATVAQTPNNDIGHGIIQLVAADSLLANHLDELPTARTQAQTVALRLFPQPARTWVSLESASEVLAISCVDVQGRTVPLAYTRTAQGAMLQLPSAMAGIYVLRVHTGEGWHSLRLWWQP